MPTPLPIARGTSTALYPWTQIYQFYNTVSNAENGNTYRSPFAPPTVKFNLPYNPLLVGVRNSLLAGFASAKGQFTTDLSVTTDQEYDNLSFDSDEFESIEHKPLLYGVQWTVDQVASSANIQTVTTLSLSILLPGTLAMSLVSTVGLPLAYPYNVLIENEEIQVTGLSVGVFTIVRGINGTTAVTHLFGTAVRLAPGNPFPTINNGCLGGYPFKSRQRFKSIVSKMESGPKFTFAEFAGTLANFPTGPLKGWEFTDSWLTDADAARIIAHFIANWGNLYPFPFTDEDATVNQNVYYASPTLSVTREFVNHVKITPALIQMGNVSSALSPHGDIVSANMSLWSAYEKVGGAGPGTAGVGVSIDSGATFTGAYNATGWDSLGATPFALFLHTGAVAPPATGGVFQVRVYCVGTLFSSGVRDQFEIYNISLTVTYADTTTAVLKPHASSFVDNSTGGVVDTTLCYDADTTPPTTFGYVYRTGFSGTSASDYLIFSDWR